jgi:ribonucleoside-diphosphate reductase alpha chain
MALIRDEGYRASVALAREKGAFPLLDTEPYLDTPGIRRLPHDIRDAIARSGVRNSHLTAIAPAGTISLLANNISSGIEPIFAAEYARDMRSRNGRMETHTLQDYACRLWQETDPDTDLPPAFVTADALTAADHLAMQAAVQPHVDHAISKTINVAVDIDFDDFQTIYLDAFRLGLKGCTTFRNSPQRVGILGADASRDNVSADEPKTSPGACPG